ncbi:integrase, catalytic region, zinc finger, CCHC-type containing protein [Tanacetum coccineum]
MILESVENGPLIWPTVEENGVTKTKKYVELSAAEKIQGDCDMKDTNIILQGLPADIYSLVNHHRVAKDLWERVQLLMQSTSLTKKERVCKLYDAFDKFTHIKGETLHKYYLRFTQLINDMNIYNMKIEQFQVNIKFLNSLPLEWSKFVTDSPLVDLSLAVLEFSPGDDPISCLNKAIAFLTAVASSRFPSTNNQLRTSSNLRKPTTIQACADHIQQVQRRQGQSYSSTGYKSNATSSEGNKASGQARILKCYNCQGEGHMARQCTQPKRPRNAAWYKEKTEDLDTYDSDCDDISNAQVVLMANISNYGSDIISEVPHSETNLNDMVNEGMQAMQDFEQPPAVDFTDNEIHSDSNIIPYSQYLQETQQENVEDTHLQAQQDSMILSVIRHIESKEKEDKYIENEIDLEKKITELDNILYKVGQSAQTVHMLTKPQAFYDNIHKQALGYQNPYHLKKAQRIKPTLYDGIVMSDKHVVMHVIDDEETLILEEKSRSKMSEKAKDPEIINKNISHNTIDYEKLNRLFEDFGKQAPKELPKISLVNESLKKLKFHLARFDNVVKIRTTPDARTDEFFEYNDLKAQLQDKDSTICKIKGKEIVDIAAQIPSANTIVLGMFKLDLEPLAPKELLVYVRDTCPNSIKLSAKKVVVTPKNIVKKVRIEVLSRLFSGTVRFGNDHIARIMGYGDYQLGNVTISTVYYVEGLGHNLFFVGQFCDADLELAFWKNTCFISNLEGVDLLSESHDTNLYMISLDDMLKTSPICLLSKASKTKSWLWHLRLSHLNFNTLNKLAKYGLARGIPRLKFQKDHLCSTCALGKSKKSSHQPKAEDTNQEKLYLLHMDLCGPMRVASINGKRRNRTLVEAARTMLIFSKAPLFLWAEAINTACYTQNRSLIRRRYNKTPYELMQDKKPDLSFFHVFGALCYPTNDDLGKLDAKADIGIFVGYAPAKKAFRIYNKRTQKIIETIHVTFDELTAMASEQFSSGPGLHSMTPATSSSGLVPNPIPQQPCIPPPRDDWDRLFQPMFDEYFTPPSIVVSPVQEAAALRAVVLADSPVSTSIDQDAPSSSTPSTQEQEQSPNISQGFKESPKTPIFHDDPLNESPHEESTSQGSSSNVRQTHTPFEHLGKWTKNHPIANVIGDPSRSVSMRKQL